MYKSFALQKWTVCIYIKMQKLNEAHNIIEISSCNLHN